MGTTRIGATLSIEGELSAADDVTVSGRLRGKIESRGRVLVERGARVEADIAGRAAEVHGELVGDVSCAERVELKPEAAVAGNIRAPRILIADGARFRGNVDMGGGADARRGEDDDED